MTINVASLQRLNYVESIGLICLNLDHWQRLQSRSGRRRVARQMPHAKLQKQWNTRGASTTDKDYNLRCRSILHQSTNQATTQQTSSRNANSLTTKVDKWWTDCLTKKINLPTNHQVPKLLILHLRCKVGIQTRHIILLLSAQCIQGVHESLSSMEICRTFKNFFTTVYGLWNAYGYEETRKFTSNFRISNQGVLNWSLFEIGHKQNYSTSLLLSGSLDHFIGHHLHRSSLNQAVI